jgi:hypothetical protein
MCIINMTFNFVLRDSWHTLYNTPGIRLAFCIMFRISFCTTSLTNELFYTPIVVFWIVTPCRLVDSHQRF